MNRYDTYRDHLLAAHQRHQADDPPAPLTPLQFKNRQALEAWRHRLSAQPYPTAPGTTLKPFLVRAAVALSFVRRNIAGFRGRKPTIAGLNGSVCSATRISRMTTGESA